MAKSSSGAAAPGSSRDPLIEAQDCLCRIELAHQANLALELLVTPSGAHDREQIEATRTQLGALLSVLNENMARWIERATERLDEHAQITRPSHRNQRSKP